MTARTVVMGKGFVGFAEAAGQSSKSGRIGERSEVGNSFDSYMGTKQGVNSGGNSNRAQNNNSAIKKMSVNDKMNVRKDTFSQEELQSMNEDVNPIKVDFEDGKITVTLVKDAGNGETDSTGVDIKDLIDQIKEFLQGQMDLTEDEIEKAFYECGFNAFSLLQLDNLQQFFANVNGMENFSEVLTDSGLLDAWNSLMSGLSELTLTLDDGIAINASAFGELADDDEFLEAIQKYLDDMSQTGAENGQIASADGMQVSVADGDMQMNNAGSESSGLGSSEMHTEAERSDNRQPAGFDDNLFQTFINNIQESVADLERFDNHQIQQIRDIAFQIIEGVKVNVKADTSSLEIQLNPEALGKVNVAIELKDGIATANFIVRNEMARIAVESQLQTLKDTFAEQGLKVEAVSVTVSDFAFDQRRQAFSEREDSRGGNAGAGKRRTVAGIADVTPDEPAADEEAGAGETEAEHGINITA